MKRSYIFLLLAGVVGFSSCVKEDQTLDPKDSTNVIEIFNEVPDIIASPTTSTYPLYINTFDAKPGVLQDFSIVVNYTGSGGAPQDISVALELAPDAIVTYNDENGEHFVALPPSLYTADNWNLTIPKGQKKATMNLKLKTAEFDFSLQYVLAVRIKSASTGTISKNYGTMLFSINAKNKYDGIYLMEATSPMVDVTNASLTGWYPISMQLITYSSNSVALYDGINYVNAYGHPIKSGTGDSYYGTFSPIFFIDESTGAITVKNYYGELAGGNLRSCVLNPAGVNKATFNADGTVKSLEVSYIMTQSAAYTPRTYFHEKFTYEEPR